MKVFEVGFIKTGTTSLGRAYELLGLKHLGWDEPLYNDFVNNRWDRIFQAIDQHEAFEDLPWQHIDVKVLDARYPRSKFIFLDREDDSWIRSVEHHQVNQGYPWDSAIAAEWIEKKRERKQFLQDYFDKRPNDFLTMGVVDGWEPLCKFLDRPIPETPFPWLNKSNFRQSSTG